MSKRLLSLVLSLVLILSMMDIPVQATEPETNATTDTDISMEATDSFGEMLTATLEEETAQLEENHGFNIFSIEMVDKIATVSFETAEEADKSPFMDVKEDDYFYNSVIWAVENNITAGMSSTKFAPNIDCTRAQVVTFLWRAAGQPEPNITSLSFVDVPQNIYYYKAVLWAVENEITSGYNSSVFGSEDKVTRSQFVTFLWRAKGRPEPITQSTSFTDVPQNTYYYKAIFWAVENNVTAGYYRNLFAPDISCTRAQVVSFLYRSRNIVKVNNTYLQPNSVQKYAGKIYTTYDVDADSGILKVPGDGSFSEFIIYDGHIYYYSNGALYRMKLDGSESTRITGITTASSNFCIYKDVLYYYEATAILEWYSKSLDLKTMQKMTNKYFFSDGSQSIWLVKKMEDYSFGTAYDYSYCLPGYEDVKRWPHDFSMWDVYEEYIFYRAKSSIMRVHVDDIGNYDKEEVVAGPNIIAPSQGSIWGDGLYYEKYDDSRLYRTDLKTGKETSYDIIANLNLTDYESYEIINEIDENLYIAIEYDDGSTTLYKVDVNSGAFKNCESAKQIWKITKCSDQFFTEYREMTYTVELEEGSVYTILPRWSEDDDPGYLIMDFEVDMENRIVEIYMDSPEGMPCWETLVIDLKNNTYYGTGFFVS